MTDNLYTLPFFKQSLSQLYLINRVNDIGPNHYVLFRGVHSLNVQITMSIEYIKYDLLEGNYKKYYFFDDKIFLLSPFLYSMEVL